MIGFILEEKLFSLPWSVGTGKNCSLGLEYGRALRLRSRAVLKTAGTVYPNKITHTNCSIDLVQNDLKLLLIKTSLNNYKHHKN